MKTNPIVALVIAIGLIIVGALTAEAVSVSFTMDFCAVPQTEELPKMDNSELEPTLNPALRPVCGCESSWEGTAWGQPRQYNPDGTLRRGYENSSDIGMCQINTDIHGDRLKKLNLDVTTKADNIRFANLLFSEQGYQPWSWSKKCWQDHI